MLTAQQHLSIRVAPRYSYFYLPVSNYEQLELLMNERMEKRGNWWGVKPQTAPVKEREDELMKAISDLKRSNEDLASEVWQLKSAIDFLLKSVNGK